MLVKLIRKILYKEKSSSEAYVRWMRKQGAMVGERTVVFVPTKTLIDMTRPWLINIGDDVQITQGVTILTHGYDWSVLKGVYGDVLGSSGEVVIGNNVFIGMNTTILKGVHVGDNVIIGANSLINSDIPSDCVVAGNPGKVIMSLDDYYSKRKALQLEEATELVRKYRERYGREPKENELSEFFFLFTDKETELWDGWRSKMKLLGNYEYSIARLEQNKKMFDNMNSFLKSIK